ncbi:MAG: ABC transporter permease [Acidobacteriaceae bacterium]|nr:ABC transporter permease [Acidobacteriaceae bacterium]MBV9780838.1 ABC transporter permease [Acidobacteriaceae bacterium]
MFEKVESFLRELKVSARSLSHEKGLMATVIVTLALGIGANAAMFSLVRGVLLRPLVNRDENRLIYIRQSARGMGTQDATFSIPEIVELRSRVKALNLYGDFSQITFTMVGLGQPRTVNAGVVNGSYFKVMGLRPVLGRLLDARDDGPNAAGAVVLTYRFWSTALKGDPTVLGKTVRLDSFVDARSATVVGVLEPCVPYPQETEIIANVVTSSHHLSATMVTNRIHRMTELLGRLAPGATLEMARAQLQAAYARMKREHPEDYPAKADYEISAVRLRDELTSGARTILLVLMATSVLIFIIACSNVANLILARSVRREAELGIRAALGASAGALRRTLLAESLLLCIVGALLGLLIANPMVSVLAHYMSRFSVRAIDLKVDSSVLWVGAGLAIVAAALLAFVPRLPLAGGVQGFGLSSGSTRVTGVANRKLRIFAVVQIAASFVLVASAGAAVKTLLSLEAAQTGLDTRHVLAVNVPVLHVGKTPAQVVEYYREATRRIRELPGVQNVAIGMFVPWLEVSNEIGLQFGTDGHVPSPSEEHHSAGFRIVSPGFFATLGLPLLEGRDFNDADRSGSERVVIISQSVAQRIFPHQDPLNHHLMWTDPILQVIPYISTEPARIIGVVADLDDGDIVPKPTMTVYRPADQEAVLLQGRLFVHVRSNPYALVTPITRIMRSMSADQPVEHAATLDDIRAEVLSPERLNAVVFSIFAGVALLIAVVGVAGVLAFSVSGRTREFGIRLAVGSQPRTLLMRVIAEGAAMAIAGLALGLGCGIVLARVAGSFLADLKTPGVLPVASSALILLLAAVIASVIPAARAARVDVIQALRTE